MQMMSLTTHQRSRMWAVAGFALLAALVGCNHDTPTSTSVPVAGLWTGRLISGDPADSILLILEESATRVDAFGYFGPLKSMGLKGVGTRTAERITVPLTNLVPSSSGGLTLSMLLDLTLSGDELHGQANWGGAEVGVSLHRMPVMPSDLVGHWTLASLRVTPPVDPVPFATEPADTIVVTAQGRATWSRDWHTCGFTEPGIARPGDRLLSLEYIPTTRSAGVGCLFVAYDTLRVHGDSLVRSTQLVGGRVEEWVYVRR